VIAYVDDAADPAPLIACGSWEGTIASAPVGAGGFGYDPLFVPSGGTVTAAQMPSSDKNAVSHRAHALAELARLLR
jgi:XTP/dITP diphosphohydrolase